MSLRAVLVPLFFVAACGGQSTGDARAGSGGSGGSGAAGGSTGGSGAAGGTGSTGGTGGSDATGGPGAVGGTVPNPRECNPDDPYPTCVADCGADSYDSVGASCNDGTWVCPAGSTLLEECPEHSCRRDGGPCCDRSIGVMSNTACEDGVRLTCPPPLEPMGPGGGCMPEGVTECSTLHEKACASVVMECHNPGRCSTRCTCEPGADGVTLTWQCYTLLC